MSKRKNTIEPDVSRLTDYEVKSLVGEGMLGKVYRAFDTRSEKLVALKVLKLSEAVHIQRLQSEFRLLSTLRHHHLVDVYDYGLTDEGRPFFAMEWVSGKPAIREKFLDENGNLMPSRLVEFIRQVTSALIYISSRNLVHGDIKPENILVDISKAGEIHASLMDFGITRDAGVGENGISGTFEYMAPEVIRGETPSEASDLYSLGCVLYEIVAGEPPFQANTPLEILKKHLNEKIPHFPEITQLDDTIKSWIHTLLEKDVRLRYRTPEQLYKAASEYLQKELEIEFSDKEVFSPQIVYLPRENENAKIKELMGASVDKFQCVCIEGSEGLGKSFLLRDVKVDLQLAEHKVFQLPVVESQQPFAPIVNYFKTQPFKTQTEELEESASIFNSFFPETFTGIPTQSSAGLSADAEVLRLFHATSVLLSHSANTNLIIDGLHEADDLTQEFVGYFISFAQAQEIKNFFLLTSFDPSLINRELFSDEIQASCNTISLQPLTKDQLERNIELIFSGDMSPSFTSFVWNHSKGNPGEVEDILQFCFDEGVVEQTRHGWILHERDDLSSQLPTSLTDKLRRQIERQTEGAIFLLKAIAISPIPVEPTTLEFITHKSIEKVHELGITLLKHGLMDLVDGKYIRTNDQLSSLLTYNENEFAVLNDRYIDYYEKNPAADPGYGVLAEHQKHSSHPQKAASYFLKASKESERIYDYKTTKQHLLNAVALPNAIEDDEQRFGVFESIVKTCNILGDRDCEADYIEEMLILAGRWKGKKGSLHLAKAYDRQTEYYLALADFEKAKRSAERALRFYTEAGYELGIGKCYQQMGYIQHLTKSDSSVIDYYLKARDVYIKKNAIEDESNLLIDIGLVYYSILEDPIKALEYLDKAKEQFLSIKNNRGAARAYGNMGVQYFAIGDYETAYNHHAKANELFQQIGDFRAIAISNIQIGRCKSATGMYIEALKSVDNALQIGKVLSDIYVQENCHQILGETYTLLGDYANALNHLNIAKNISELLKRRIGTIACILNTVGVFIEQNKITEALNNLTICKKLLTEIKDVNIEAVYLYRSAQVYATRGDSQNFTKALDYFLKLGEVASSQGFNDYIILAQSYSALCYAHLGLQTEALDLSNQAIQMIEKHTYIVGGKQDIYFNHARILRSNKMISEAGRYIVLANDELNRIANEISVPDLYRSFIENVSINAEIIREYSLLNRDSSSKYISISKDQNLRTLYDVSRKINSVLDLPRLLENIMDSALEAMNGERGLIFLLENNELTLKVSRNVERETIEDATEISLSILQDVVSGGKPIIISDTSKDDEVKKRQSVVNYNIHSIICVPMKSKNNIIGTVYVDSRADALSAMTFSDIDADFLEAFANLATIAIENARLHTKLQEENLYLKKEVTKQFGFENIIGSSKPMEHLFRETQSALSSEDSVFIFGESGTGKELIARAIHYNGKRKDKRFVAIDCGAVQDTLLESELFGYKRGAFTGAVADKKGLFEEADKGTLFLDEIGNTSLAFQAKLLRVLQDGDFRRVGDTQTRKADVRIIAATNTDIQKQISEGNFRQDLYYRLNVIPIQVPALQERLDDIPLLVNHFIQQFNSKNETSFRGASKELIEVLQTHYWPGNVRELENLTSRMLVQCNEDVLTTKALPSDFDVLTASEDDSAGKVSMRIPKQLKTLKEIEQEHILYILSHTKNNKTEAAKILGLKRTTLVEKMKKLELM